MSAPLHDAARVQAFLDRFVDRRPAFAKELLRAQATDPATFGELAPTLLGWAAAKLGEGWEDRLIDGYCAFVYDVNRSQARYEQTGAYAHRSFEEVRAATYDDPEFMGLYHWGVFVTTFGWTHHLPLYRLYRDHFLAPLAARGAQPRLLDLGCGSGVWHLLALRAIPGARVQAVDISPTSVAEGRDTAAGLGLSTAWTCADATTFTAEAPVDGAVSGFLLEHLEQPQALIDNLARNLAPGGLAFITCALTAAEVDHIYELRRESEPVRMCEEAGLRVLSTFSSAPAGVSPKKRFLPRSMGLVLERRRGELW
jgi:2-polyprenyl-3-methyl-5-hydroxy-6-metoxy-1,4-benzoquinol methylase